MCLMLLCLASADMAMVTKAHICAGVGGALRCCYASLVQAWQWHGLPMRVRCAPTMLLCIASAG